MEKEKCKNKAEVVVPWAGKILICCKLHGIAFVAIGNAIGSPVEPKLLPPNNDGCEMMDDLED